MLMVNSIAILIGTPINQDNLITVKDFLKEKASEQEDKKEVAK